MSGYRPPYTLSEEKEILQYIVKQKGYYELRGRSFWLLMEDAFKKKRTWQSLKEHFCKHMFSKISNPLYELTKEEIDMIKEGYKDSAKQPKSKTSTRYPAQDLNDYLTSSDSD